MRVPDVAPPAVAVPSVSLEGAAGTLDVRTWTRATAMGSAVWEAKAPEASLKNVQLRISWVWKSAPVAAVKPARLRRLLLRKQAARSLLSGGSAL
jgi:hypothetical protein